MEIKDLKFLLEEPFDINLKKFYNHSVTRK
jgi:hypothetical protein